MNSETSNSIVTTIPAAPHCQHSSPSGRRCRMAVSDPVTGLCFRHATQRNKGHDLAAKLIGETEDFTSAVTINHSLGELYKLLAHDEIAPRRAAVMAYTCNLLLRTLPAIRQEQEDEDGPAQLDFTGWPRGTNRQEPTFGAEPDIPRPDQSQPDRSQPYRGVAPGAGDIPGPNATSPNAASDDKSY